MAMPNTFRAGFSWHLAAELWISAFSCYCSWRL